MAKSNKSVKGQAATETVKPVDTKPQAVKPQTGGKMKTNPVFGEVGTVGRAKPSEFKDITEYTGRMVRSAETEDAIAYSLLTGNANFMPTIKVYRDGRIADGYTRRNGGLKAANEGCIIVNDDKKNVTELKANPDITLPFEVIPDDTDYIALQQTLNNNQNISLLKDMIHEIVRMKRAGVQVSVLAAKHNKSRQAINTLVALGDETPEVIECLKFKWLQPEKLVDAAYAPKQKGDHQRARRYTPEQMAEFMEFIVSHPELAPDDDKKALTQAKAFSNWSGNKFALTADGTPDVSPPIVVTLKSVIEKLRKSPVFAYHVLAVGLDTLDVDTITAAVDDAESVKLPEADMAVYNDAVKASK